MQNLRDSRYLFLIICLIVSPLLTQCTISAAIPSQTVPTANATIPVDNPPAVTEPKIEILFRVQVPESQTTQQVFLDVLDEVTGLALNSQRFPMEKIDEQNFLIKIPFAEGTLLKYRYARAGNEIAKEYNALGSPVRYRMYYVSYPGEVTDLVAAWADIPYQGETGEILGTVHDVSNNPLPDILVSAGGVSAITASDGSYILHGLPTGTHNLAASSIHGNFQPYQQGATVAANSTTPAPLILPPAALVNITFTLTLPQGASPGLPIRIVGNIYSLGNTFSDLPGGVSITAARAPHLTALSDGRYAITIALPAGMDLRYKYTMGDGFWNGELNSDGSFRTRQLIVPNADKVFADTVEAWQSGETEPISFDVQIPEFTPSSDIISIQFNPLTWTEPIPMWPAGGNRWTYILYNPLQLFSDIGYRYCRNDQCDTAGAVDENNAPVAYDLNITDHPGSISDVVSNWAWMDSVSQQTTIVGKDVIARGDSFIAGVELSDNYAPSNQAYLSNAFQNIQSVGANWVFVTPTWHFTSSNPPILEPVPGQDPLWADIEETVDSARSRDLGIALFPFSKTVIDPAVWWSEAVRDAGWWQTWFDRYQIFLMNSADFAQQHQVGALLLGEPGILPALPGGTLSDGSPSGVFLDADVRWNAIIAEIRSHYDGKLIFAVQDTSDLQRFEGFLENFDEIYVQVSSPLSEDENIPLDLYAAVQKILDQDIYPFWEAHQKPIILGIKYPSTPEAIYGCIRDGEICFPFDVLDQPVKTQFNVESDLDIQFNIYEAFLSAVNERAWITGFVSRGYFPSIELFDTSSSVHGKPAAALLWYWFPRFISAQQ